MIISVLFLFVELTVGLTAGIFWMFNFSINQITPFIICSLQLHGFFYFLVGNCVLMFFFVLFALPETKVSIYIDKSIIMRQDLKMLKAVTCYN